MEGIRVRRYTPGDAVAVAGLIRRALLEVNSRDYSLQEMNRIAASYTADAVERLAGAAHLYVAEADGRITGCGCIGPHDADPGALWVQAVFTHPDHLGRGVGRVIMAALEGDALVYGAKRIALHASLTAEGFYLRLGYTYPNGTRRVAEHDIIPMEKGLHT